MRLTTPQRRLYVVLIGLLISALACSLSTSGMPQPTASPATQPAQTMPPVARVSPTKATSPTPSPTPTETPLSGSGPGGCVLSAQFIADVTIPDNTVVAPGTAFVKTWRVGNTGTCAWDENYQLVFSDGNQLGGPAAVPIKFVAPAATLEISINLIAPTTPGTYTGRWRLKASNGVIFGGLTAVIAVPATPTPTVTNTPEPTASAGIWNGKWETNCGTASCGNMRLFQTGNVVTGTFATDGVINATANGNRLTGTWSRGGSAGSIDWWMGGTGVKWRGNYNAINGWCGHRAGETDPAPCSAGTFAGNWNVLCVNCDGAMLIAQDGRTFTGTYPKGTVEGTIDGVVASGTWKTSDGSSGPFTWYLLNGQQFNGNYDGTNQWCGYRSGSGAPTPCLK